MDPGMLVALSCSATLGLLSSVDVDCVIWLWISIKVDTWLMPVLPDFRISAVSGMLSVYCQARNSREVVRS